MTKILNIRNWQSIFDSAPIFLFWKFENFEFRICFEFRNSIFRFKQGCCKVARSRGESKPILPRIARSSMDSDSLLYIQPGKKPRYVEKIYTWVDSFILGWVFGEDGGVGEITLSSFWEFEKILKKEKHMPGNLLLWVIHSRFDHINLPVTSMALWGCLMITR